LKLSQHKNIIVGLLLVGLFLIALGWMVETVFFGDLGGHSTNSQAFDVIHAAAADGTFSDVSEESELYNTSLQVANEASRAVMSTVRTVRSYTVWFSVLGALFVLAGGVAVLRVPVE